LCNASGKGVRQEKETFAKEIEMTPARAQSLPVKFSVVKMIGNFVGVPLTDADRGKVLFNCWSPPSGFSFPYVTVGAQN